MGAETYLHLMSGTTAFIARVGAEVDFEIGTLVAVEFDFSNACLFDAITEEAIA
jgi:hypothetical protein